MNIVRQRTGTDSAYKQNLYGSGIGIAVLDSGIYPHPDFMNHGSRITAFRDFVNHRQTPYDDNGHGTHIAGIIAGSGYLSEGKYMGMAPRAHLIILKILDSKGNGTAETVCRAIEWTVRNRSRFHIHILNISIGAKAGEETTESRMLIDAAEYAWDRGLTVVAAAKMDYKQQKELQAKERKRKNQLKKTMERIDAIDARLKELDELLVQEDVYTNVSRLMEINKEKEALDEEQLTLMELWEELEGDDDSLD